MIIPSPRAPKIEVAPGLWPAKDAGMVFVANTEELDIELEPGAVVAELAEAVVQTRICNRCSFVDTDAWKIDDQSKRCEAWQAYQPGGVSSCRQCRSGPECCHTYNYGGCALCRPEKKRPKRKNV